MEVSDRILVFSKGRLEQAGSPSQVYEDPATEFVARFIGSMNILEAEVKHGVARVGPLEFPAAGHPDGRRVQVGFRPYHVRVSEDPAMFRLRARLRHTYFLGVAYRLEIETEEGLLLRSRMNKEEFRAHEFQEGAPVSYAVTQFRILPEEGARAPLPAPSPVEQGPISP